MIKRLFIAIFAIGLFLETNSLAVDTNTTDIINQTTNLNNEIDLNDDNNTQTSNSINLNEDNAVQNNTNIASNSSVDNNDVKDGISMDDLLKLRPNNGNRAKNPTKSISVRLNQNEFSKKDDLSLDDLKLVAPTNEPDIATYEKNNIYEVVKPAKLTLSTTGTPKIVFVNQIFKIDLKADMQKNVNVDINVSMNKSDDLIWINEGDISWIKDSNGLNQATLWFEANSTLAKLNNIKVTTYRNGELFQESNINPIIPNFNTLKTKDNFSHIVADNLEVRKVKTSFFDEKSNIITVDLAIKNGDLRSFYLHNKLISKQGIDSLKGSFQNQQAYYFAIVDKNMSSLDFSYFNLSKNQVENFSFDTNVASEDLSTQVELNPKDSMFKIYRNITLYVIAAILFIMFIVSKNFIPLVIAIILVVATFIMDKSSGTGILKKGSIVRVLPIKNSTIFYSPQNDEKIEIFNSDEDYRKVLLKNGKIGWALVNDIKKD